MKKLVFVLVLVLLAAGGALYATPYLTASDFGAAVAAKDQAALEQLVDFDRLRASLKKQLKPPTQPKKKKNNNLLDALGDAVAGLVAGITSGAVDLIVTPEGFLQVLNGDGEFSVVRTGYTGLNTFEVAAKATESAEPFVFVLERQGIFEWKIVDVVLPKS